MTSVMTTQLITMGIHQIPKLHYIYDPNISLLYFPYYMYPYLFPQH